MAPDLLDQAVDRAGVVVRLLGLLAFGFGVFSAAWPGRSMALYQRIMAWCNWDVRPIAERREILTTRVLGAVTAACGLAALALAPR